MRGRVNLAINGSFWIGTALGAGLSLVLPDPRVLGPELYDAFFNEFMAVFFDEADARYLASLGLNAVRVPDGVDEAAVRKRLLEEFSIEVGSGLGPLAGKLWRVGMSTAVTHPETNEAT